MKGVFFKEDDKCLREMILNQYNKIIIKNINLKKNILKNIENSLDKSLKDNNGIYWKFENDDTIFWSKNNLEFNKDIIFKSSNDYFLHRQKNNLKKDWTNIKIFNN